MGLPLVRAEKLAKMATFEFRMRRRCRLAACLALGSVMCNIVIALIIIVPAPLWAINGLILPIFALSLMLAISGMFLGFIAGDDLAKLPGSFPLEKRLVWLAVMYPLLAASLSLFT